jgi:hypothetical protein
MKRLQSESTIRKQLLSDDSVSAQSEGLQNALDEGRTLILGAQIIVGLSYRGVFEPGYDRMPLHAQYLMIAALVLVLAAFVLLMAPVAFHRIVDHGGNSKDLELFVRSIMKPTLPLFALSMGLTIYIAVEKIDGTGLAAICGVAVACFALLVWSGVGSSRKQLRSGEIMNDSEDGESLNDKIKHVLTEARMVLPGAQALLGFQFVTMLLDDFDRLPESSKQVHLLSLLATALSTIFLMTPAAHHRIVERGANTERFHQLASRFILMSMAPLALGIAGDFYVVMRKVTASVAFAATGAAALLAISYGFWFGYSFYRRSKTSRDE